MIHVSETDTNAVKRIAYFESPDLAVGATVPFAPGGMHLMLMDLADKLDEGAQLPLTQTCVRAGANIVDMPVLGVASTRPESCGAPCADQQALLQAVQEAVNVTPMREMVEFLTVSDAAAHGTEWDAGNWRALTPTDDTVSDAAGAFAALSARGTDAPMVHVLDRGGRHAGIFHGAGFVRINMVLYINGLTNAPSP
jgi:hypothetical protein